MRYTQGRRTPRLIEELMMNTQDAKQVLLNYPNKTKVADVYDTDPDFREAIPLLFPSFEYPDFSYLTVEQVLVRLTASV
ncbi:hypothetical protein F6X40_09710 [Paraburkholderia sp. UCT31]|uniref:hypothetical protein n=1 Tax=Paraburkholderia sp. UCT31 TaxID=2615209 RepID=UPI001654E7BB|nr:hypothetical protein [Paraburkholderia sp. UCT31]MBC8737083.1 hypothetical protein [Paraburkholderia sp. UCT31]